MQGPAHAGLLRRMDRVSGERQHQARHAGKSICANLKVTPRLPSTTGSDAAFGCLRGPSVSSAIKLGSSSIR